MRGAQTYGRISKKRKASTQKKRRVMTQSQMVQTDAFSIGRPSSYPLGRQRKCTMIYGETFTLNPGVGSLASYVFRANSCYDPNLTGIGHQPRGFDQLMALYDHGTVIASKIDVGGYNTATQGQVMVLSLRDTSSVAGTFNDAMEVPKSVWTIIPGAAGGGVSNLSLGCNPSKFMGRSKPLSEDNLRFSDSADALDKCFFHIYVGDPAGGDPLGVNLQVRIEYTVILTEPHMPGES